VSGVRGAVFRLEVLHHRLVWLDPLDGVHAPQLLGFPERAVEPQVPPPLDARRPWDVAAAARAQIAAIDSSGDRASTRTTSSRPSRARTHAASATRSESTCGSGTFDQRARGRSFVHTPP